jgi:hypothetical protein
MKVIPDQNILLNYPDLMFLIIELIAAYKVPQHSIFNYNDQIWVDVTTG